MTACSYKGSLFPRCRGLDPDQLMVTERGLYSVTPGVHSRNLMTQVTTFFGKEKLQVVDMTACNGGDSLAFALAGYQVVAVERDSTEYAALSHNVKQYPRWVQKAIRVLHGSSVTQDEKTAELTFPVVTIHTDLVYFDPPWGGKDYKEQMQDPSYDLYLSLRGSERVRAADCIRALFAQFPSLRGVLCKVPPTFAFTDLPETERWSFKKHEVLVFLP